MVKLDNETKEILRKHALLNAYKHGGKANLQAVVSKVIAEKPELRKMAKEIANLAKEVINDVNSLSREKQYEELKQSYPELVEEKVKEEKKEIEALPPLPNAEHGKVVTRFPPEPNGYLHIGHAKALILNYSYAKLYKGRFILRFDDTNPVNEKMEFYNAIRQDIYWLEVKPDIEKCTSDDIPILYEYAKKLISIGKAYVCTCSVDVVRKNRALGIECLCRSLGTEENLERWEKMFDEYNQNEAILRLKGDMKSKNTAMRDPTLFRIVDSPHPLKGNKYRVWPTYDFSVPIEDHLDCVTHAMRSKEYELRDEVYYYIQSSLGLRNVKLIEFSRLEMKGTPVSKRKIKDLMQKGIVRSWDDPRLSTLMALRRRGFTPDAIKEFVLSIGLSKTESEPTWDLLESFNRKVLDRKAKRLHFVQNPVLLEVKDAKSKKLKLRFHPEINLGFREILVSDKLLISEDDAKMLKEGDLIRLIELYNVKVLEVKKGKVKAKFAGEELILKVKKIHWVDYKDSLPFKVLKPLPLYLDKEVNENSLVEINGKVEKAIEQINIGEVAQFVRFGFCKVEGRDIGIFTHR
jgi:glutamyl-tRNA synthetase